MKIKLLTLLILIVGLLPVQTVRSADEFESDLLKELRLLMQEKGDMQAELYDRIQPITINGKVLDQNGDPVPRAEVEVHWRSQDPNQDYKTIVPSKWFKADSSGNFTFTLQKARRPSLWEVRKRGYEFDSEKAGPYYKSDSSLQQNMVSNSEVDPIIIYMRKLNPTTFLLKSTTTYEVKGEGATTLSYTMIPGLFNIIKQDYSNIRKPLQKDLIFSVNKNEDSSYTMQIKPVPQNGGSMQLLDEYLYEAPADGYQSELTVTIYPNDAFKKYLYFTSRKTPVFSRMELKVKVDSYYNELDYSCDTWTNPYGKRNLEWEPDLPFDIEEQLRREAKKALNEGTLPPEPDNLQALIEQYSEK